MKKLNKQLKAPFPYFGGKKKVASDVWQRLGDVDNYIEPFCGSLAVMLLRPSKPKVETLNDMDHHVVNFWRAVQNEPEKVAEFASNPVFEADMHARHKWLVFSNEANEFWERMKTDPFAYDCRIAGWWALGLCCWIGSGWCSKGVESVKIPHLSPGIGRGVYSSTQSSLSDQIPHLSNKGQCIDALTEKQPHLKQPIPHLVNQGQGVNRKLPEGRPQLADAFDIGRGVNSSKDQSTCEDRKQWLIGWFKALQDRIRLVRTCCGDWKRVCDSPSTTTRLGLTGVFLDPPYSDQADRDSTIYACDSLDVAHEVREWCKKRGDDPMMRIALCGYQGEHDELESIGWEVLEWKAHGGYANRNEDNQNSKRERIWFSPHCEKASKQLTLFS